MTANPILPATAGPSPAVSGGISRLTPLDPIRVVRQHLALLVMTLIIGAIIGVGLALVLKKYAPEFTSEAYMEVSGGIISPYESTSLTGGIGKHRPEVISAFIRNQIVRIKSDDVINTALARSMVKETQWRRQFRNNIEARENLQEQLDVSRVIGSTVIRVALAGRHRQDLQAIIDSVVDVYLRKYNDDIRIANTQVRNTFEAERKRADEDVRMRQEQLDQFLESHDLATLETQNNEATIAYQDLARQVAVAAVEKDTARKTLAAMIEAHKDGTLVGSPDDIAIVEADPAIASRDERIRALREDRDVLLHRFGENHRSVLDIDRQIIAVELQKKRETALLLRQRQEVLLEQARKRAAALEAKYATLVPKLEEAGIRMRDLVNKLEKYRRLKDKAGTARQKSQLADEWIYSQRILRDRPDRAGVQSLAQASAPKLTFPRFGGTVAGVAVLLEALAIALVFLKELLDQRIKSPSDVTLIPRAEIIGVVPEASQDPSGPARIENVVRYDPSGLLAEAFRQTRSGMLTHTDRGGFKTVMVVGAQPESGVSATVNNLAISLGHDGRKVLVIDANFRRPVQHELFETPATPGLVEILTGKVSFDDAVAHVAELGLDVLAAGQGQTALPELLEGASFAELLEVCQNRYDIILIDAPPALLTSESQMLGRQVGGVLGVVRALRDKRGMVGRMLRQFESQDANVIGLVLNGVQASAGGYFRSNYEQFRQYRERRPAQERAPEPVGADVDAEDEPVEPQ